VKASIFVAYFSHLFLLIALLESNLGTDVLVEPFTSDNDTKTAAYHRDYFLFTCSNFWIDD